MKITVTKKDIEDGQTKDCISCPVALATKRKMKTTVHVWNHSIFCFNGNGWDSMILPKFVVDFIHHFDEGKNVKPFSFNLNLK